MSLDSIQETVKHLLAEMPPHVTLEAAAKTRPLEQARAAVEAGVTILGYNYVQEAEHIQADFDLPVRWHLIGHLQKNKAKKAVQLFDMIETVDSPALAKVLEKECAKIDKIMPILIEINSGRESNKAGIMLEDTEKMIRNVSEFKHLRVQGLMTMGPLTLNPEDLRSLFRKTRQEFIRLRDLDIPNVEMKHLSMGMSNSYPIAIEEGATLVRIGTRLFGPRE